MRQARSAISAQLVSLAGVPVGQFQAALTPLNGTWGEVNAGFVFPGAGLLIVSGVFDFQAEGPPQGLRVVRAVGSLRRLQGAMLSITDEHDGSSLFTFASR